MEMKFALRLPVTGPISSSEAIDLYAQYAESLGYYAVTTHDHVFMSYDQRYHTSGGLAEVIDMKEKLGLPISNVYETMTVFSKIAGMTERIHMIPCALVLPIRHPVLFAKQAITLDHLSDGRFICNVCIGNIPSDFDAMGVNFDKRGKIMNEYIDILKQIFSIGKVSFQGQYISISECEIFPKAKNIPIWTASSFSDPGIKRAVKYAEGMFLPALTPDQYVEGISKLKKSLKRYGRGETDIKTIGHQNFLCMRKDGEKARRNMKYTIESFYHGDQKITEITYKNALIGTPDDVINKIQVLLDVGVNIIDLRINATGLDDALQMIKYFAKEVMPSFSDSSEKW